MRAEGAVHIVRNNHQVGIVFLYDGYDACHCFGTERIAGRVARIGDEQCLYRRIFQPVNILVAVLPQVQPVLAHAVGMQFGHLKSVAVQLGNLYIRCKGGNHEGDAVTFVQ